MDEEQRQRDRATRDRAEWTNSQGTNSQGTNSQGAIDGADCRRGSKTICGRAGFDCESRVSGWPHAPPHWLEGKGIYIVTASTMWRNHVFRRTELLDYLLNTLREDAERYAWRFEAWSVFSNHYHFVGRALEDARSLEPFIQSVHAKTARYANELDGVLGRQVWFNYWDSQLTFLNSYLARLNYVHQNPVRHGLVRSASQYRWCSAEWFERTASRSHVKTVYQFKMDRVNVIDDFTPIIVDSTRKDEG